MISSVCQRQKCHPITLNHRGGTWVSWKCHVRKSHWAETNAGAGELRRSKDIFKILKSSGEKDNMACDGRKRTQFSFYGPQSKKKWTKFVWSTNKSSSRFNWKIIREEPTFVAETITYSGVYFFKLLQITQTCLNSRAKTEEQQISFSSHNGFLNSFL